jgi:diguanylate cyclase (GGDEF)-like protein
MMIDIDNFKSINDTLGHLAGDAVLEKVGALVGQVLRTTDVRCRFGGDEFLVILPETALAGAEQAAAKLRAAMKNLDVEVDASVTRRTVSIGIAQAERGELDVASLVGRADAALYQAKRAGRDTCRVAATERPVPDCPELQPAVAVNGGGLLLESSHPATAMTAERSPAHRVA